MYKTSCSNFARGEPITTFTCRQIPWADGHRTLSLNNKCSAPPTTRWVESPCCFVLAEMCWYIRTCNLHLKLVQPDRTPTLGAFLQFPWRFFFKLIPGPIVRHKRRKQIMPGLRRSNFKSTASILRCHLADQFPFCPADLVHRPNLQKLSENKNVYGRFVHVCHYIRPIATTSNQ